MFDSMNWRSAYGGNEKRNMNLAKNVFNGVNFVPFFGVSPLGDQRPDPD